MYEGRFWHILFHVVKPLTQICSLKLLKSCTSVSGEFDLIDTLPKRSFNTTHTSFKTQKAIKKLGGMFFATPHKSQTLLP
jgi:hypothetical protein